MFARRQQKRKRRGEREELELVTHG